MELAGESSTIGADRTEPDLRLEPLIDGRYHVIERLGEGGMGEVYEVEHVRLKRHFALKVLRAELAGDRELTDRFGRETRAVATLHSDHVVSIVDSGTLSDGRPYFVMERLLGDDLQHLLERDAQLSVGRAVNIAIDICLGLHAAHAAGLVHRDLKPGNVFVTRSDDTRERCKLLDFGVVKQSDHDHTRPGALIGTARYMAPEQVAHDAPVGPAADLFALGVLLYRCLSGQHPFAADSLERVLFRVMHDTPAPLPEHVPAELSALITQALAKTPERRPSSALDFARALARFTAEPRHLDGLTGWHVGTALGEGTLGGSFAPADPTPVIQAAPSALPALARPRLLVVAAGLLVVTTLVVERLIGDARRPAATAPLSSGVHAENPKLSGASRSGEPAYVPAPVAQPEPPSPAPTPSARPPRFASRNAAPPAAPQAPPAGAASAEPSAGSASLNWFDPRNPYGN